MPFLSFLLNTLRPRLNDINNKRFWLPEILKGIDGPEPGTKLLPLKVKDCNIGALKGTSREAIIDGFLVGMRAVLENRKEEPKFDFKLEDIIPDPDSPDPLLSFSNLVLNGLENQWVLDSPPVQLSDNGYEVIITLEPGYYDDTTGLAMLGIESDYILSLSACSVYKTDPKHYNGKFKQKVDGIGTVTLNITNALIKAKVWITIAGDDAGRQANVEVKEIVFTGISDKQQLDIIVDELTVQSELSTFFVGKWRDTAVEAITSDEGVAGIFEQINSALNDSGNLKALSEEISPRLKGVLDSIFGTVAAHELPVGSQQVLNRVDGYLFDRIRYAFNHVDNDWYLPKAVCSLSSPSVEPLLVDRINLPDQTVYGMKFENIRITDLNVAGFSNLLAPTELLLFDEQGNLNATLKIGELNPPPARQFAGKTIPAPPIKGTGQITLERKKYPTAIIPLQITVRLAEVNFLNQFSGSDADELSLDLKQISLNLNQDDLKIELDPGSPLAAMLSQKLFTPDIKKQIVDALNQYAFDNLKSISQQITNAVREGIKSKLDT